MLVTFGNILFPPYPTRPCSSFPSEVAGWEPRLDPTVLLYTGHTDFISSEWIHDVAVGGRGHRLPPSYDMLPALRYLYGVVHAETTSV